MGGIRNVSSDLHREVGRGSVRAARVSKKDPADKPKRHRVGTVKTRRAVAKPSVDTEPLVIEYAGTVWEALGFSPQECASLEVRSALMRQIQSIVKENEWTQAVAAKRCGVSQPRINDLIRGRFNKFSIDALVNMAGALGCDVEIRLKAA
jgi:predicted XRE-type DNA-binding protein